MKNKFTLTKKQALVKKISAISSFMLLFQLLFAGSSFVFVEDVRAATSTNLCNADVDVVLILDRSGSMNDDGSLSSCDWEELEYVNTSYQCVTHQATDISEQECLSIKDTIAFSTSCAAPLYTDAVLNKFDSAKQAANDFLGNLGSSDQSALVSYADMASLDKTLDNNHASTQSAMDILISSGATNIGDAISLSNTELGSLYANPQAVKVAILLTDGKANKPSGDGINENPADVAYAKSMASVASGLGYKIFTIGLGSDTNVSMLQDIASVSGGEYFSSPTAEELAGIYDDISKKLCQYGSISGCKYNDINNDAGINGIDTSEPKLDDWEIVLDDGVSTTSQKTVNGCFNFAGLEDGDYTVSEKIIGDWVQTYPTTLSYSLTVSNHNSTSTIDFANYLAPLVPTTYKISGYKYNDKNNNGLIDDGGVTVPNWGINLIACTYSPLASGDLSFLASTTDISGASAGSCSILNASSTDSSGYYEFDNLIEGDYVVGEATSTAWIQTYPSLGQYYYFNLNNSSTTIDFANYELPYCGDGECDGTETCSTCSSDCGSCGGGGEDGYCGDGDLDTFLGEECDDNNNTNGDGCNSECKIETCGDGVCQAGETCSTCSSDCGGCGGSTPLCILQGNCGGSTPTPTPVPTPIDEVIVLGEEGEPILNITKTNDMSFANPGDTVLYKINITNTGNLDAFNLVLVDNLPFGLVFEGTETLVKTWDLGDLVMGSNKEITYKVKVTDGAEAKIYTNTAVLLADNHSDISANVDLEVILPVVLAESGMNYYELLALVFASLFLSISGRALRRI